MKPFEILYLEEDKPQKICFYVVPKSVQEASLFSNYGVEPWCTRCNDTFFWDKNIKGTAFIRNGTDFKCANCGQARGGANCSLDENGNLLKKKRNR